MTTAFLVGLCLGFTGGFTIACLFASGRAADLQDALGVAHRDNQRLRDERAAIQAKTGQIFLSPEDAHDLRKMKVGL